MANADETGDLEDNQLFYVRHLWLGNIFKMQRDCVVCGSHRITIEESVLGMMTKMELMFGSWA